MTEKLRISIPIAVEGKYDKIKLSSIVDGQIITTDGFQIFSSAEKKALVRRLAEPKGIIVLTDSDGAGLVIRKFFSSVIGKDKLYHLYIPRVQGKEKRKKEASKEGLLGVEGIDAATLRKILEPFADSGIQTASFDREVTKTDFYNDRLSGHEDSAARRSKLCELLELPDNMSSNSLLAAVNLLVGYDKYRELAESINLQSAKSENC